MQLGGAFTSKLYFAGNTGSESCTKPSPSETAQSRSSVLRLDWTGADRADRIVAPAHHAVSQKGRIGSGVSCHPVRLLSSVAGGVDHVPAAPIEDQRHGAVGPGLVPRKIRFACRIALRCNLWPVHAIRPRLGSLFGPLLCIDRHCKRSNSQRQNAKQDFR